MRALLDVNVLLALFDTNHVHHARARDWLLVRSEAGWASCPLTQNGFVRVISQPRYPEPIGTSEAIALLEAATSTNAHEFWPADITLLDSGTVDRTRVHGPRQLTDLYLLALAVKRGGCLATFDEGIPISSVPGAQPEHLVVL
jgi:uncharacterized protein